MPVQTKRDVFEILHERREAIRALGVRRCGIFGSFAHDRATPGSDVDVLVEFEPGEKTFQHFMGLVFLLEEAMGRPVEVVTVASLSPYLRPHILDEVEYVALDA
jgi:hypothetical protein